MTDAQPQVLKLFSKVDLVDHRVLVPADYNPRRMSRARARQLAASLIKFGFTIPVVAVRDTKEIVGGHQRVYRVADLVAAGALPEDQQVPVIWRDDLTPADARKLNIALNEIDGEFVNDGYAALLRDIAEMDGGVIQDLEAMGLTDDDLGALLDAVDVPQEQLDAMANEADPKRGARDRVVVPAKAYKFSIPTDLAEEFIEPVLKAFGHEALEILGEHGGRVAKFDGPAAAIVAACREALRSRQTLRSGQNGKGAEPAKAAPETPEAPPKKPEKRTRKKSSSAATAKKSKAGKTPATKGTARRRSR